MNKKSQETQDHFIRSRRTTRCSERSDTASSAILRAQRYCELFCFLLLTSYFLLAGGCGYSTRSLSPGYIQKVHVKIFENNTVKIGLDELATNAVIDAFLSGSSLKMVDENNADIVVEGRVSGYSKEPFTYTANQAIIEYKITVKFSVRCIDKVKNEVFWEGDMSDWATYSSNEEEGLNEAMKKTAERLVTTILTNW